MCPRCGSRLFRDNLEGNELFCLKCGWRPSRPDPNPDATPHHATRWEHGNTRWADKMRRQKLLHRT